MTTLEGKKKESASRLGMGLGGLRYVRSIISYFTLTFRNVSHGSDFQEITQVEASTKLREPSIMDEDTIGSFSRRNEDQDDLSDLLNSKKVTYIEF